MADIRHDLMSLLLSVRDQLDLPEDLQADFLPAEGDALSFQSDVTPKIRKAYINGNQEWQYAFSILAVVDGDTTSAPNLKAMGWLESLGALFEGMHDYPLSDTRIVRQGETTTPALITRTQDGRVVYSIQISIVYKEKKNA